MKILNLIKEKFGAKPKQLEIKNYPEPAKEKIKQKWTGSKHHNKYKKYGSLSSHKRFASIRSNRQSEIESRNRGYIKIMALLDRAK